jgi:23S rRNA (uracil1939-C5)-methyltransferase
VSYEEELRFKLQRVNDALRHIGKQQLQATKIIGSEEITRYRNKGIFAVAPVGGQAGYGFYRERSHDLIAVDSCLIQNELTERCARAVTEFINARGIAAYDEATGKGTVRHVFCRRAIHTGDAVVCIVSARGFGSSTDALVSALREACPELSGIVLNINKVKGNTVLSGEFFTLWGKAEICDTLCGLSFSIAPQAFYQINPAQAERLYNRALEYACPQPVKLAFDLYCGAGTISLCLARQAERVIGAEIVPEAIENAKHNAAANGIENAEFICADAGQAAELLAQRGLRPDVIVVDPPRKGMDENAVAAVASMAPERVVYVSCNPATLARDVLRFNALGYELRDVTAVDMFPRTGHVECVGVMVRKDK